MVITSALHAEGCEFDRQLYSFKTCQKSVFTIVILMLVFELHVWALEDFHKMSQYWDEYTIVIILAVICSKADHLGW